MNIQKTRSYSLLAILLMFNVFSFMAQESPFSLENSFKLKGTGPKYWIAYEYCWTTNTPIPEDRWKKNIDWVNENFKSFGYDMISNDGWIEAAQTIDEHGYIVKYNDEWEHSFEYWADYLKKRNMTLGVYYNPMWMTKAAFDSNVEVKGTNSKAQDIVGPISFNEPLYWVDTDREGAKEWIQGYVKHFIDIGATYLRIDFLENYERNYGAAKYIQALKWIKEAAGDQLLLSLVMPNCFDHCRNELPYGDMLRIDDDCFEGGWEFVSNRRRGQQKAIWPQYGNAFDGFIGFADIGGRGQMILDGDFMRLNTMANDKERMFLFSLMVMGGSALAIADQFDTIGESAWIYQNTELLELNNLGFVAKPLSYDHKDITNSSIWAGQLPNGDWVVGFFNREESNQNRSIDFNRDLGITGNVENVRDLWTHTDLGAYQGGYSVELAPHESKIIRLKTDTQKYEAEFASMIGNAKKGETKFGHSGSAYATDIQDLESRVLFAVEVPSKGEYSIQLKYSNTSKSTIPASLNVNDQKIPLQLPTVAKNSKSNWSDIEIKAKLNSGINFITVQKDILDNSFFDIDYIRIYK